MRLTALMLFAVSNGAFAQMNACVPSLDPDALARVSVANQFCGIRLQSNVWGGGSELRGDITIGVDANDAIRILQNSYDPPFTLVQPNPVTHVGRDEPIYWGIWSRETQSGRAMPYLAGVESRSLPNGVVRYSLTGAPFMVSSNNSNYAPVANADNRSNPIDPGPISRADLTVDFGAGTATLNLRFTVRGAVGDAVIELRRRTLPSQEFEEVGCEGAPHCSVASLRFYGRGATHAGVLLTVSYDRVIPESQKAAAYLSNVSGNAAIALRRR